MGRQKKLRLTPSWLPVIRDHLVVEGRRQGERGNLQGTVSEQIMREFYDEMDTLSRAPLWWVSEDMKKICVDTVMNGLRASEPLKLGVSDYYRVGDTPVVHVNRKFDWMQEVGLSERAAKAVERAIGERRKGSLLVWKGKRVTYPQLAGVVAVLGERVGAARRITPHSLRRSFATEARRRKVPDREIMASGGWSTREMLDRYDMNRLAVENTASVAVAESLKKQKMEDAS